VHAARVMAFDSLHVPGLDVRGLPLHRRRRMLEQEVADAEMIYAARLPTTPTGTRLRR